MGPPLWPFKELENATSTAIEFFFNNLIDIRCESDFVVRKLSPGYKEEGDGVVVETFVTVGVGRNLG